MQAVIGAHCKKFTGSRAYVASFIRCGSDSLETLDMTSQATSSLGFKGVSLCKQLLQSGKKIFSWKVTKNGRKNKVMEIQKGHGKVMGFLHCL